MRILLSGGAKTGNIAKAIGKKFEISGDTINIVNNIENIDSIFEKGDYFDKCLIAQPSITNDGRDTDELTIRNKVNHFALTMRDRGLVGGNKEYVFLIQSEDIASMVSDEIIPLGTNTAVVLVQPPYSVKFFTELLVTSVRNLPASYLYVPEVVTPETVDDIEIDVTDEIDMDDIESLDVSSQRVIEHQAPNDLSQLMFGGEDIDTVEEQVVSDSFGSIDGEDSTDYSDGNEQDFGFDSTDGSGQDFGFEEADSLFGESYSSEESFGASEGDLFGADDEPFGSNEEPFGASDDPFGAEVDEEESDFNMDGATGFGNEPIQQSGDIPDYMETKSKSNVTDMMFDDIPEEQNQFEEFNEQTEPEETAETVETTETTDDFSLGEATFNEAGPVNDFIENQTEENEQVDDMSVEDFSGNIPGFDVDMYDNKETHTSTQMGGLQGFDDGMYVQPEPEVQQPVESEQGLSGFDNSMYGAEEPMPQQSMSGMQTGGITQGMDIQQEIGRSMGQVEPVKEKRGLFGRRKKAQAAPVEVPTSKTVTSLKRLKDELDPFAARGNSILVTGCGGCGTSWVAFNLANIIHQLGYTVLLVDMDTLGRTQSYISKRTLESIEPDGSSLISAVNSTTGISAYQSVVKTGFHLLTNGLAADAVKAEEVLHRDKINRFANSAKSSHNFVIYDIPFDLATTFLSDITYIADDIVCVTDTSNWGITKMMQSITNVSSDDMQEVIFAKTQILFNRQRNLNLLFGSSRIKTADNILKAIDKEILELLGEDPGVYFKDLGIAGVIDDDPKAEASWYADVQYSDTQKGQQIFLEVLRNIVLRRH